MLFVRFLITTLQIHTSTVVLAAESASKPDLTHTMSIFPARDFLSVAATWQNWSNSPFHGPTCDLGTITEESIHFLNTPSYKT